MKKFFFCSAVAMISGLLLLSCEPVNNEDGNQGNNTNTTETETEIIVSGVWKTGETIQLNRHLVVPEGESLTIEPGVTIIVSDAGVGVNHVPVEIMVKGNLYALGTESQPITFSVAPELRTKENTFKGLGGGIVA